MFFKEALLTGDRGSMTCMSVVADPGSFFRAGTTARNSKHSSSYNAINFADTAAHEYYIGPPIPSAPGPGAPKEKAARRSESHHFFGASVFDGSSTRNDQNGMERRISTVLKTSFFEPTGTGGQEKEVR